jgi:hypothetical protein
VTLTLEEYQQQAKDTDQKPQNADEGLVTYSRQDIHTRGDNSKVESPLDELGAAGRMTKSASTVATTPEHTAVAAVSAQPLRRRPLIVLPEDILDSRLALWSYQRAAKLTDHMPSGDLSMPVLGLFGEIGTLGCILKKKRRDAEAYTAYRASLSEELGDVLWYLCSIASRAELDLSILAKRASSGIGDSDAATHDESMTFANIQTPCEHATGDEIVSRMIHLATCAGELVADLQGGQLAQNRDAVFAHLVSIFRAVISAAEAVNVSLETAARENLDKVFSRWPTERRYPARRDIDLPLNERLPARLNLFIEEHTTANGKTYVMQKCNGVIVGDRLTDNKAEKDDYRFHDVFHIAYAVHLGWSPVLRSLLHLKRKSRADLDENEDGARAVLIEEGIATFIFGRALERGLFEGLDRLDYDLLKLVSDFVRGFEPEQCSLWQWERAVLGGFTVFRALKKHRRGYVRADLENHTIVFEPGDDREYE